MHLNIRVAGASGQWVNSLWNMIANIFAGFGYKTVWDRQYQSLIKWWINYYDIVVDSESINISEYVDIILALNLENAKYYAKQNPNALIIINNKYIEKSETKYKVCINIPWLLSLISGYFYQQFEYVVKLSFHRKYQTHS